MREEKRIRKRKILTSVIISILVMILVAVIVKDVQIFTAKTRRDSEEIASKTKGQVVGSEILYDSSTVEHECRNYLESKYDKTNHWEECSICGTKYNQVAHTYEERWTMGETCNPANKCIHTCSCGYSYQSNNMREHDLTSIRTNQTQYSHYQYCKNCDREINTTNCTKDDGTKIDCGNLGTCAVCGYVYTQVKHRGSTDKDGDVKCSKCSKYIGTISNLTLNYVSSNTLDFSYDLSVKDTGNFNGSSLDTSYQSGNGATVLSHTKTNKTSTSVTITGKIQLSDQEIKYYFNSYVNNYYVSSNELISSCIINFSDLSPDREPPVINSNIVQNDLATSNGWATQKQLTITGTENFCSSVKLTLKDSDGNIYLNNASTTVTDNNWSYTFTPNIEANEAGKEFTITAIDNLDNRSERKFTVYKTDKKPPTITSASETAKTWTKSKDFAFTATEEGSGGVSIALNNTNDYVLATKTGTTYSRNHTFTEEVYGSKNYTIYFKDGLGNTNTQTFKVHNIDNTAPTITRNEIVKQEIVLTGNDKNASQVEGSGIAGYRYLGSSAESVTITESNSQLTTSNKIPLLELQRVKYAYIMAVDKAGNTSDMIKVTLPTYKIAINPNGGTWRGSATVTELAGYHNGETVTIEKPTRPGYEFTGWKVSTGTIEDTTYTFTLSNATLQAEWSLITPTIVSKIGTSTHTVATPLPVENDTGSAILSKEDGRVVYHIRYTSTIKNYIGKAKLEMVSTLPAEIDIEQSELAGGKYQKDTHTITWVEEIASIDTFANGDYIEEIIKPIAVVYQNQDVTKDLINTVVGKTTTYYPEGYLDKGGQEFVKQEKTVRATVKQDYKVNLKVMAKWNDNQNQKGKRPEKVTITIKEMPKEEIITKELTPENNWTYEEIGIPKYNVAGEKITYLVTQKETEEGDLEYYEEAVIAETETQKEEVTNQTFTITNDYKLMSTDLNTEITIKGTDEIQTKDQEIEHTLHLKSKISDYIGEGKVIVTDTLPYPIDLEKSDIANGSYDEERKTITWEEPLPHINTQETKEDYNIDITKSIKLTYLDIDLTEETITNPIKARIELYETEEKDEKETSMNTNIKVPGKVVVKYLDQDTQEEIAEKVEITDKIGKDYHTEKKEIEGYRFIEATGNTEGKVKEKEQEVIYYYKKLNFNIGVEKTIESINLKNENVKILENKVAQIELNANEMANTNLIIKYKIKVTNKGELAGTTKIVEEIPQGYQLEEIPEYWKGNQDGNLETELELASGESKDLSVTQKWMNQENNLGSKSSTTKIVNTGNVVNYLDSKAEDDVSTTTICISTKKVDDNSNEEPNKSPKPDEGQNKKPNDELDKKTDNTQGGTKDNKPTNSLTQKSNNQQKEDLNKRPLETIYYGNSGDVTDTVRKEQTNQQNNYTPRETTTKKESLLADNLNTGDEIGFIVMVVLVVGGINVIYFVVKMKKKRKE